MVIGFLFSFLNDAHERRAAEIVRAEMPDAYICTSSEVANVIREYERFSTAAMNGFVGPKTSLYLNNLQNKLSQNGFRANLRVIQSNGGIATVETCSQKAVGILMSGPAGGVIGGRAEGFLCGRSNLITVDIGGTSADISTIPDGRIKIMNARDSYVNGHPILVPMIDLVSIGAGGGSIAYIDSAGGFHVGPRSAGAEPGPACYGRGGEEPTVTDAQVVLGRLDADKMLGGDLPLNPDLAHKAVEAKVAKPLGLSITDAALGIIKVINSNMALGDPLQLGRARHRPARIRAGAVRRRRPTARGRAGRSDCGERNHRAGRSRHYRGDGAAADRHAIRACALLDRLPQACRSSRHHPHQRRDRRAGRSLPARSGEGRRAARNGRNFKSSRNAGITDRASSCARSCRTAK